MVEEGWSTVTVTWLERDQWSSPPPRPGTPETASMAPRFEREGTDLILVVPIGHDEARTGAMVTVPTPGASVRLRVPPGTETGKRFRVPRVNAPAPDGFGDLVVVVEVVGPINMADIEGKAT